MILNEEIAKLMQIQVMNKVYGPTNFRHNIHYQHFELLQKIAIYTVMLF